MNSTKLKEDLSNCLINFDRRVLITQLLDDYQLAYEEVNTILQNYLIEQEIKDKIQFKKTYLVHGQQEHEHKKEIYEIVEESNLKELLNKLKNAESSLYAVEVAGGAKAAAPLFKPMRVVECVKAKARHGSKSSAADGVAETTSSGNKKEVEQEKGSGKVLKENAKEPLKTTNTTDPAVKKSSKTETSPTEKKLADKKSAAKKGINNFFAPSTATLKKSEDTKDSKTPNGIIKPPTPKKMQDFFKKQAEKTKTNTENLEKTDPNTSVQLFNDDEEEDEVSSDEEEKLEALKRDIISSDVEMEEDESKQPISAKRRRILDSDDEEEDPPIKQEKLDIKEEPKQEAAAETYIDEDGFVITKKPKLKATSTTNKSPAAKKMPPVTIKSSPKEANKSSSSLNKDSKKATNPTTKTKQARIMNFFSKK